MVSILTCGLFKCGPKAPKPINKLNKQVRKVDSCSDDSDDYIDVDRTQSTDESQDYIEQNYFRRMSANRRRSTVPRKAIDISVEYMDKTKETIYHTCIEDEEEISILTTNDTDTSN